MSANCILCNKYGELENDHIVWLMDPAVDGENFVCNECLHQKLNSGSPVGGCLYCESNADYNIGSYRVRKSTDDNVTVVSQGNEKPMLCESHFNELKEHKDHTLSIGNALDNEPSEELDTPIPELIGKEEGKYLEYKETFIYNTHTDQADSTLKEEFVQEICAFGNSSGGTVIIGVTDGEKEIEGVNRDLKLMPDGYDEFERRINQAVSNKLGTNFGSQYVSVEFHEIEGETVCAVSVEQSGKPVIFGDDEFFVRDGSSSRPLNKQEYTEFLFDHWGK